MKVLVLANNDVGLYRFRRELLEAMNQKGYEVFIALPDGVMIPDLRNTGSKCILIEFNRRGTDPAADYRLYRTYRKLMKKIDPDVVLTYTIKPNVYGGMAAARAGIPCIANVTGLGTAIVNPGILQSISLFLYRKGLRHDQKVFFQNRSNEKFFADRNIADGRRSLLPGSGVNLEEYTYQEYPHYEQGHEKFLFVSRVMKDKGIEEFEAAARAVKKDFPDTSFQVLGEMDEDYTELLTRAQQDGVLAYHDEIPDVKPYYKNASVVVLPTYHEGMSNVLQEASAMGRPVIASDIPGCREIFAEEVTGFGVEPGNTESLEKAMRKFIALPRSSKEMMGLAARRKVQSQFDRQIVVDRYLAEIEKCTR
jgi:galacturonosyltransferase